MLYFRLFLVLSISFVGAFSMNMRSAEANILITPTRVVFEGRDRFGSVTLVNNSGETRTYNIEWVFFKMEEGGRGTYKQVDAPPTDFDLSKHIVYSPRRVTLAPGASQKVRLALRRPAEIPVGDYHIHMKFFLDEDAPEEIIVRGQEKLQKNQGAVAGVNVNVSYSIPVILTVGEPNVQAEMGDLILERNKKSGALVAKIPVERSGGPYSIHGFVDVYHVKPDGSQDRVGELGNAHIFPETKKRIYHVVINEEISGGSLRVVLRHYDKEENLIYAERVFPLQ